MKRLLTLPALILWKTFFWTYERGTPPYDLLVIAILVFIWFTPPGWLHDPMAKGPGLVGLIENLISR